MDASTRVGCLPGTKADVLESILRWVHDETSHQNILWLHGPAGTGKSTLSTTIATIFGDCGQLGAFLFFDRDVAERSDPKIVIRTLAYQLGLSDRKIGNAIRTVVDRNLPITLLPPSLQFQRLVLDALATIDKISHPIVIVLDALDESGNSEKHRNLLEVLSRDFANLPWYVRTIITSRAENDICAAFKPQHHILEFELDIMSEANSHDILSYLRHSMMQIRGKHKHQRLSTDWPGEDILRTLDSLASGWFVWASTASQFIDGHDPRKLLDVILRGEAASGAEAALDSLYETALMSAGMWDDVDFIADFREIFGIILVACQPLSSTAMDALLHRPKDRPSIQTLIFLQPVLQQSPTVRFVHPSFAEFLTTRERCVQDIWFFD